jgi:long-chain acyl-CoA synthetase
MIGTHSIYRAPPDAHKLVLGRTLPSLLDEACDRYPNPRALNQWRNRHWQPLSNVDFRTAAEEFALGLLDLSLQRGDRIAFLMHSDIAFSIADMGCLLAGLVDVPIDLTQTIENIVFILEHTETPTLIVSNLDLLQQVLPYLREVSSLQHVIVAEVPEQWEQMLAQQCIEGVVGNPSLHPPDRCLHIPHYLGDGQTEEAHLLPLFPPKIQLFSLTEIRQRGRSQWSATRMQTLRQAIAPSDLATILYIASETKRPKGVMLSHENISADILSAFANHPGLEVGDREVALLFLPLTHIFARAFLYGHLAYGHCVYFSEPNHVIKHLQSVHPTILITVPRLLEKVYERMLEQPHRLSRFDRTVYVWALKLAQRYQVGRSPHPLDALQLKLADRLVFAQWRSMFGDRLKALISGGAALRSDLTNLFSAAGIPVLQGYGLTETSAVLSYNRGKDNQAGTVGKPIAGVEIRLATDGEILVKSPFVMQGYYRDWAATQKVLDADGWLHTGDLGEITEDGFLKITGVKKALFKLSTGKYVSPRLLEQALKQSPLIAHAITVGANYKFCGMLIVPDRAVLQARSRSLGIDPTDTNWLQHPCILALYQSLIDAANCHLPDWSTVRKFRLLDSDFTRENGLLEADGSMNRLRVLERFASEIEALYRNRNDIEKGSRGDAEHGAVPVSQHSPAPVSSCPQVATTACPTYARSLTQH